jgi:transposase
MTRKRRSFTPEFKQKAACLVLDQGCSIAEASRSLDVGENALRQWVMQLSEERGGITPKSKALTLEQQRIQELEACCERLEREKSILKKATVSSTGQRKYVLKLFSRYKVVECLPRPLIQLPRKCI